MQHLTTLTTYLGYAHSAQRCPTAGAAVPCCPASRLHSRQRGTTPCRPGLGAQAAPPEPELNQSAREELVRPRPGCRTLHLGRRSKHRPGILRLYTTGVFECHMKDTIRRERQTPAGSGWVEELCCKEGRTQGKPRGCSALSFSSLSPHHSILRHLLWSPQNTQWCFMS